MKKWPSFAIGFCFCAVVFGAFALSTNTSSGITNEEEYLQKVRSSLTELSLPASNNPTSIDAAPERLSNYMAYRSGVQISNANRIALRSIEQNAWNSSKRVDAETLTRIITDVAIERIPTLSNGEIAGITDSLRGFNASGLPQGFQAGRSRVKLRASGIGQMSADQFSSELTELRDGGIQGMAAQNLIYVSLSNEVGRRVKTLIKADPQYFGGTPSSMTPAQALLVTYAVVTDDLLAWSESELAQKMQHSQQLRSQTGGSSFPSPSGHRAYGDNGYLHSSPASIILSDASVAKLLTLIDERSK